MPEISRFLGIVIRMYFKDHDPAHFHVSYEKYNAMVSIKDFSIIQGNLPLRIHAYVIEWGLLHKKELMKNWKKSQNLKKLTKIEPLI